MKIKFEMILLTSLFLLVLGCGQHNFSKSVEYSNLKAVPANAVSIFNPQIAADVENSANCILKGSFLDDATIDFQRGSSGNIVHGTTISTFQISEVLKGEFQAGDEIEIVEDYYIDEINGEHYIYYLGNYYPSEVGKEYMMFLREYSSETRYAGKYYAVGCEFGRYPVVNARTRLVDVDSMSNESLNLGEGNSADYRSIYEELIEKYMS